MWALAAAAGVLLVAGVTYAASQLSSQAIGISSEPLSAGEDLAPRADRPRERRTPTPAPTATRTATPTATVDDDGGGEDESGHGRGRGRGRGRGGDDD
jgi:hypothetical protein